MNKNCSGVCTIFLTAILAAVLGCSERNDLAPVVESHWRAVGHANTHRVEAGETLYAIAFRYDLDYRKLAALNQLTRPYHLQVGQILKINANYTRYRPHVAAIKRSMPIHAGGSTLTKPVHVVAFARHNSPWMMPCSGKVIERFAPNIGHKGMTIAGVAGEKIYAAASGVVAYAGDGIKGYGNLIIIKHNQQYMTAYGYNARNLVHEGQHVTAGQVIANMGMIDQHHYGLHFEIRNAGKPVNPENYYS